MTKSSEDFVGSYQLRARVVCSVLSSKAIRVLSIREEEESPGLRPYEVLFLKLVDQLTSNTTVNISNTGTQLSFNPGFLIGGSSTFDCSAAPPHQQQQNDSRSIFYFVEGVLPLLIFTRRPTVLTLYSNNLTPHQLDFTPNNLSNVTLPLLRKLLQFDSSELTLDVNMKEGTVVLTCTRPLNLVKPLLLLDSGLVKRVRGLAFTLKASPQFSHRLIDGARSVLNNLLPDVYIHTQAENYGVKQSAYGISLYALSTTDCLYGSATILSDEDKTEAEDLGIAAASSLCEEIATGGCVDSSHQWLVLLFMALGEGVSKVRLGQLTEFTIHFLRLIKCLFGVVFQIKEQSDKHGSTVLLSCKGVALKNISRSLT